MFGLLDGIEELSHVDKNGLAARFFHFLSHFLCASRTFGDKYLVSIH